MNLSPRFSKPVAQTLHLHEFNTSRFFLKLMADARKLNIEVLGFYRDGSFIHQTTSSKLVPDGVIVLKIKGKAHVFCLEMDQGTQSGDLYSRGFGRIEKKLFAYQQLKWCT